MSDTGRDRFLIPDDTQSNYERVRVERGWSWEQMAEQFDKDGERQLAAWSRAKAAGDDGQHVRMVGDETAPRGRRGAGRRRAVPAVKTTAVAPADAVETAAPAVVDQQAV